LQDETKLDISRFAHSFLDGLNLTSLASEATEYIVENAQGVFLWVKLIGEELLSCHEEGYSEVEVLQFLKELPTKLEEFYSLMLEKITRKARNLQDGVRMFHFVLLAKRPLREDEMLHFLGIPDSPEVQYTPSDDSFQRSVPSTPRIISCGGNFLEIKTQHGMTTSLLRLLNDQVCSQSCRNFNSSSYASNGARIFP
jgi:hypothetical protein